MTWLPTSAAWRQRLQAIADQPPLCPRVPLWWYDVAIGSVDPELVRRCGLPNAPFLQLRDDGCHLEGELTWVLGRIADCLRATGLAHVWRDEQLPVRDAQGATLGSVERAVVRSLGIATEAVHLVGLDSQGRHWMQLRALDKASDPGLWDTLVGGMVPAGESLATALERETWEEAGLELPQLAQLRHGGQVESRGPSQSVPHGYVVERIHWFACILPDDLAPRNLDGEVAEFRCMEAGEVVHRLERDEFTLEAALILMAAFGPRGPG
ncbi:MAG TPA: NUDIX domain-containing protein [Ramlibacter sp.]|nr:NUDIX domain-containing protein [Ramlibacter sp.]